jgi:dTMP kinase
MRGKYISFEGTEGCGKSTQAKMLYERMLREDYPAVLTKQPGGTPVGVRIREILLDPSLKGEDGLLPEVESLLFAADRYQHRNTLVKRNIKKGISVITDRERDSTWAYQFFGRGVDERFMHTIHDLIEEGLAPDITFWYDGPVEHFLNRAYKRNAETGIVSRFDDEMVPFHQRVRDGFMRLSEQYPERIIRLDGTLPVDVLHEMTWNYFSSRI